MYFISVYYNVCTGIHFKCTTDTKFSRIVWKITHVSKYSVQMRQIFTDQKRKNSTVSPTKKPLLLLDRVTDLELWRVEYGAGDGRQQRRLHQTLRDLPGPVPPRQTQTRAVRDPRPRDETTRWVDVIIIILVVRIHFLKHLEIAYMFCFVSVS